MEPSREMGYEGFAMIGNKFYGSRRVFPARQGRWVVQVPHDEMEEPVVMNTKEVAARFGGILAVNHIKGKPQIRCVRPI